MPPIWSPSLWKHGTLDPRRVCGLHRWCFLQSGDSRSSAKDASPAVIDPTGHNQLRLYDRKVVTVAVAAAVDALQRSTIGSGSDHCLRAGWFTTVYGATSQTSTLNNCYFTSDVGVTGLVRWRSDNSFEADLAVHGEGTVGGILHVAGTWRAPGPVGYFKVTGTIGGLNVALLVPEA